MSNIILIEGSDNVGKSTIGQALADHLHYDYFKMKRRNIYVKQEDPKLVEAAHAFQIEWFYNFATSVNFNVVLDRFYLSELVYGSLFRKIDEKFLWEYDKLFSEIGLKLILLHKKENFLEDELWTKEQLIQIQNRYFDIFDQSLCQKIKIDTTDENLEKQLSTIVDFLK